jgi:hypothetical protein
MDFEDARVAVYGLLDGHMTANHPTVKVGYENRHTVDLAAQALPYVTCEIVWNDGEQVSLGDLPRGRLRGSVWLSVHVKEGQGVSVSNELMKSLFDLFRTKTFSGVTTMMPVPVPARAAEGWRAQALRVPLYFDDAG